MTQRYQAVLFDLLTALIDSWSLWNSVAGDPARGFEWRAAYLHLTYGAGGYRNYEAVVSDAARRVGLPASAARQLTDRWGELEPWPEAASVLARLREAGTRLGVVTNCSEELGHRAAARLPIPFDTIVTAERAGFYKPDPHPYLLALSEIGTEPGQTLFVAGSPADIPGASGVGMPVIWHNHVALPVTVSSTAPLAIYHSLQPLLEEVLADRAS